MKRYPHPEKRVYLSAAIAGLSIVLASVLFSNQSTLIIYYSVSTVAFTVITFLAKKRLYTLILRDESERTDEDEDRSPWKAMLLVLFMSLALFVAPLLLAGILSGSIWFTVIVSFTSGVSISEIILYLRMR